MNKLREVRVVSRVTQFRLALKTGINATKISFIENDLIEPSETEKGKLARALDKNIEEVFPTNEVTLKNMVAR